MRKLFAPKKNSKVLTDSTHPATSESSADKILARRSDYDLAVDPYVPLILAGGSACFSPGATTAV
jgi:hypothetical protein